MQAFAERTDFIFNTRVYQRMNLELPQAELLLEQAVQLMKGYEKRLSFYLETSEVSAINHNAGKQFIKVSSDTFEIIKEAKACSLMTDGLFDITVAPLVKAWRINSLSPQLLEEEKRKQLAELVNYEDILLNEVNQSVMLARENQKIDLGGIAKGYIADKIIDFYKANGAESGMINIGGNTKVLGRKNKESLWHIGIAEPVKHSEKAVAVLQLEDVSVVTSGAYERAFSYNGQLYHHILNPRTGAPAQTDVKSITLISSSSVQADALATPLFIMGKVRAAEFMKQKGLNGIIITQNDEMILTRELIKSFSLNSSYKILTF